MQGSRHVCAECLWSDLGETPCSGMSLQKVRVACLGDEGAFEAWDLGREQGDGCLFVNEAIRQTYTTLPLLGNSSNSFF